MLLTITDKALTSRIDLHNLDLKYGSKIYHFYIEPTLTETLDVAKLVLYFFFTKLKKCVF